MPVLDNITQRELLHLLGPLLGSEQERRALLQLALGLRCPVLSQVDFSGAAEIFILRLIEKLDTFGEVEPGRQALWAVMETIKDRVGVDRQARIDALRPLLNTPSPLLLNRPSMPSTGAANIRPPSSLQPAVTARPSPPSPASPADIHSLISSIELFRTIQKAITTQSGGKVSGFRLTNLAGNSTCTTIIRRRMFAGSKR